MSEKTVTQLRIDSELYENVKRIAEKELRSVNNQIEYLILQGVERYIKDEKFDSAFIAGLQSEE